MKINLLRASEDFMSGYVNVDPFGKSDEVVIGEYENLNYLVEDAQCTDLIARDILDYIGPDKIDTVLFGWINKIRHGGKITLGGTDMFLVSMKHFKGDIDTDTATALVFGRRTEPHLYKKNLSTLENVASALERAGFKVITKRYDQITCKYVVTGERP
jgi:hypothetical protein